MVCVCSGAAAVGRTWPVIVPEAASPAITFMRQFKTCL